MAGYTCLLALIVQGQSVHLIGSAACSGVAWFVCLAGDPPLCLPARSPVCAPLAPAPLHVRCSIPLRLSLTFSLLEGTMCAWVPPPPGNRAFYSFVAPPRLELTARPEVRCPRAMAQHDVVCCQWLAQYHCPACRSSSVGLAQLSQGALHCCRPMLLS